MAKTPRYFRSRQRLNPVKSWRRQKRDQVSGTERLVSSVKLGFAISVISAFASAIAAWETAQQAKYAQQALTASDLNRAFESFYDSWSTLCDTIDVTGGYIGL